MKELKDLSAGDILEFEVWDDDHGEMMTKAKAMVQGDDFLGRTSLSVKDRMLCLQWAAEGPPILVFFPYWCSVPILVY